MYLLTVKPTYSPWFHHVLDDELLSIKHSRDDSFNKRHVCAYVYVIRKGPN